MRDRRNAHADSILYAHTSVLYKLHVLQVASTDFDQTLVTIQLSIGEASLDEGVHPQKVQTLPAALPTSSDNRKSSRSRLNQQNSWTSRPCLYIVHPSIL